MMKNDDSSFHPTTSHYSPLLTDKKSAETEKRETFGSYQQLRNGTMVDTITTDDSLCDDQNTESRSNSTMGSSSKRSSGRVVSGGSDGTVSRNVDIVKCVFLFVFLFVAGLSNWAVIAYTHDFVPREPLPDLMFSLIDEQPWASLVGDLCVATCVVLLAVLLLVHKHRWTILRRVVFCAACLYSMRSVTLAVTQLPSSYKNNEKRCRERVTPQFSVFIDRLLEQTIRIGFQSKESMLCGDLLFSGHTLVMVTCSLSVAYYLPRSIKPLQWIAHIGCTFGMICMIISRTHYTIDVVIAYWLSNFVFRMYHAFCEVDMCMERRKSILYSWWPCRVIDWLEEGVVPGRIDNRILFLWSKTEEQNVSTSESESSNSDPRQHHKQVSISSTSTFPLPC